MLKNFSSRIVGRYKPGSDVNYYNYYESSSSSLHTVCFLLRVMSVRLVLSTYAGDSRCPASIEGVAKLAFKSGFTATLSVYGGRSRTKFVSGQKRPIVSSRTRPVDRLFNER